MTYRDYYKKNVPSDPQLDSEIIQGLCTSMCPEDEEQLRIREKMVHFLEVSGSQMKLVKSFSRSAADANMAVPKHLRPYPVLKQTMQYLLLELLNRPKVSSIVLYDFVNDRLRAIRQDMTIQRLPADQCITLLEPMIRFYVYFGYKLCQCPVNEFDQVLNKKYLLECIKWFLSCCNKIDSSKEISVEQLLGGIANLHVGDEVDYKLVCDRILVESLYILCNLDNVHSLYRYLTLSTVLKSHPALIVSYRIAVANLQNNYVTISKLIKRLSPLAYCAVFMHLPAIQKRAISTMSVAYNSPRLTFPALVMRRWLHVDSDAELMNICRHYGLNAESGEVQLIKTKFNDANVMNPVKNYSFENTFIMDINYLLTYTS